MRPSWSDPLDRPFGCLSLAEASSSLAEFAAPHETTTMSAAYVSRSPSRSTSTSVTAVPAGLVRSARARAFVSSVTFGVLERRAARPSTSASDLACTRHGKPSQVPQRTQWLYGMFASFSITPQGAWNGWCPAAARSSASCWIRGSCETAGNG